jgi:hypothetical protein
MATVAIPSRCLKPDTALVSLTTVQYTLWKLGMPILDADSVNQYKKRAKLAMLWRAVRWVLLAIAVLVAFECLGRQWGRAAVVGRAAVALASLYTWLVSASELKWKKIDYGTYRSLDAVPPSVAVAADQLLSCGVSPSQLGVEYLKNDPILFVEDPEQTGGSRRYDLIVW